MNAHKRRVARAARPLGPRGSGALSPATWSLNPASSASAAGMARGRVAQPAKTKNVFGVFYVLVRVALNRDSDWSVDQTEPQS